MGKRNKIRYQAEQKEKVTITLTGKVYLQYVDDEAMEVAQKGDLFVYPNNDALHSSRLGEYEGTGFSGYFKVDVYDGKRWQPVIAHDLFPEQENHFAKTERPIDTYSLCEEMLRGHAGRMLVRTYREHYTLDIAEDAQMS